VHILRRHKFIGLILLAAWLFAQQGAAFHAVSHLPDPLSGHAPQDKSVPDSPVCGQCPVYAQLSGACAAPPLLPVVEQSASALVGQLPVFFRARFSSPYSSRAPPTSSKA
jgi:hypothetical protein